MKVRFQFSLFHVFAIVACVAVLFGIGRASLNVLEREFWRVHPSEREVATTIQASLGGAYHADGKSNRHITGVWLQGTAATDADIETVLKLRQLKHLDVSGTRVTDASLAAIFAHNNLRTLKFKGSKITQKGLREALLNSSGRINLDE